MRKYKVIIQVLMNGELKVFKYFNQPLSEVMRFLQMKEFEGFQIVSMSYQYIKDSTEELSDDEKTQYALNLQKIEENAK